MNAAIGFGRVTTGIVMESVQPARFVTRNVTLNVLAEAKTCLGFWMVDVPPSPKFQFHVAMELPGAIERSVKEVESPTQETSALNIATGLGFTGIVRVVSCTHPFEFVTVRFTE